MESADHTSNNHSTALNSDLGLDLLFNKRKMSRHGSRSGSQQHDEDRASVLSAVSRRPSASAAPSHRPFEGPPTVAAPSSSTRRHYQDDRHRRDQPHHHTSNRSVDVRDDDGDITEDDEDDDDDLDRLTSVSSVRAKKRGPHDDDHRGHRNDRRPALSSHRSGFNRYSAAGNESRDNGSVATSVVSLPAKGSPEGKKRPTTEAEILAAKKEILYKFSRIESKGYDLPRKFTLASDLEDMEAELDRLQNDKSVDNSINLQRHILMSCVNGLELLNESFDPFDIRLEGWSNNVYDQINSYDEVFEELHMKYSGTSQWPPEIRLMMMLGGSAVTHHMNRRMGDGGGGRKKKSGGFSGLFGMASKMMGGMFGASSQPAPAAAVPPAPPAPPAPAPPPQQPTYTYAPPPPRPAAPQPRETQSPSMRGPVMDDIILDLQREEQARQVATAATVSATSELDELRALSGEQQQQQQQQPPKSVGPAMSAGSAGTAGTAGRGRGGGGGRGRSRKSMALEV